jgi:hypothetical protein
MSKLKEIEKKIAVLYKERAKLNKEREEALSRKLITCSGCGKKTQVGKLAYIQTQWYTTPYGCMGGDYWNDGEGQFICPKCYHLNRLYNRKDVQKLKYSFKEVVEYSEHGNYKDPEPAKLFEIIQKIQDPKPNCGINIEALSFYAKTPEHVRDWVRKYFKD